MKIKYKRKVSKKGFSESFTITGNTEEVRNFINTYQLPNISFITDYEHNSRRRISEMEE